MIEIPTFLHFQHMWHWYFRRYWWRYILKPIQWNYSPQGSVFNIIVLGFVFWWDADPPGRRRSLRPVRKNRTR